VAIFCNIKAVALPFICRRSVVAGPVGFIPLVGGEGLKTAWLVVTLDASTQYTVSGIFSAGAGSDWFMLLFANKDGSSSRVFFDVANGVKGSEIGTALVSSSISSVGGGEYLCSITINSGTSGNTPRVWIYAADANDDFSVAGDGSTVWHYQRDLTVVEVGVGVDILDSEADFSDWTLSYVKFE